MDKPSPFITNSDSTLRKFSFFIAVGALNGESREITAEADDEIVVVAGTRCADADDATP